MTAECSMYRSLIPRAAMGDLGAEEQHALNLHLAECAPCGNEHSQYAETLRQMRSAGDVPVPKHFFVYAQEAPAKPWLAFRQLSPVWQGAIGLVILLFGVFIAAAISHLNIRVGNGVLAVNFGAPAPVQQTQTPVPVIDTAAMEARILKAVEEKNRRDKLEWIQMVRADIEKSNRSLTDRQRKILQAALSELETRLGSQMGTAVTALEVRSDRALANLYRVVSSERERDLTYVNNRFSRLVTNNEVRSNQTDAILETLLQVADLKLK